MPQPALRAEFGRPDLSPASWSGADLGCGDWGTVVVSRADKPPLRFKGRRLTLHWRDPFGGCRILVELWQRQAGGFVVAHSLGAGAKTDGVRLKDMDAAMSYLEEKCQAPPDEFVAAGPPAQVFADLQRRMIFDQQFSLLVGTVLSDWAAMPNPKERLQ